jgi:CRP-like cAMP-binding protein
VEKLEMAEADFASLGKALRKVDFFAPMTIGQLELILPHVLLYRYKTGETVCRQGEEGDAFYIVRDGKVGVWVKKGFFSFKKKVVDLGAGDFFGEMSLVTREPRNATVICEEPCRMYVLTSGNFQYVLKRNPSFKTELQQIVETRKFQSKHEG